ncbi:hypothetical protein ACJMK2_020922 [Sinanodonta woodiana]|uniref:Trans-1,2-dihydrobenzene-1,2-diol dehydrogenase n=1 Tax=Sinanodonta woodiana TaxID=1069815 RepID=A0ABD3U206_SINWO
MATRWGCIGAGNISNDFFKAIRLVLPKEDHQLVAVAARDQKRAHEFADKHGFSKAYGSYEEVASDPDVEVVYIATLHNSHAELSIMMLNAGKHVVCEKPMTTNSKQQQQVFSVAQEKKLFFMEATWSRFFPVYEQIRKELANGTLGTVKLVQTRFCIPVFSAPQVNTLELGGGGLLAIGFYGVQFACLVFGDEKPEKITAEGCITPEGVDECGTIILKYSGNRMATLLYHTNAGEGDNSASILGQKGRIEVRAPFWCPTKVTTPTGDYEFTLPDDKGFNYINSAGLAFEAKCTRECIQNGCTECSLMPHRQSQLMMEIMDEARRQMGVVYPEEKV